MTGDAGEAVKDAAHAIDSTVYGAGYTTPQMRETFMDWNVQRQRLRTEAAIAHEQGILGIIPKDAAEEISDVCLNNNIDLQRIAYILGETQNDIVALVRTVGEQIGPVAREYVHYGATSQDIHITGNALVLQQAVELINASLAELIEVLRSVTQAHRETVMIGRTHGQHALPITFGFKTASWLYVASQQRKALQDLERRLVVGSLKGAVGNHSVWGNIGLDLEEAVMMHLGLEVSPVSLHASEDRYIEYLNWSAHTASLLARICNEIRALHRTEVREVAEAFNTGAQVGSSTMPHKRNAEWSEAIVGIAIKVRSNASAMMAVTQEHERDGTRNPAEHLLLGETSNLIHRMVTTVSDGLRNLKVNQEIMRRNIGHSNGLIGAEAITFKLASRTGMKESAHEIVYRCAMAAFEGDTSFVEELWGDEVVRAHMSVTEIQDTVERSMRDTGTAPQQVDRILEITTN